MANEEHVAPEELAAEQEALKVKKEEEYRSEVIEEFGFDETTDKDRIDKLVKKQMDSADKLSKAIGQKIKHRDALKNAKPADPANPQKPTDATIKGDESTISMQDQRALIKADVHDDDLDDVISFAKFNKISIADALKKPILVNTLAQKAEERQTATATNTNTTRRGSTSPSDDEIVASANKGKLPEDDESINRLIAAKAPKPKKR